MINSSIDFYSIKTLTNLHVGSGDTNYEIVDNIVQRDPISGVPVIHSSSLKGATRQYYREAIGGGDNPSTEEINIFGSDTSPRSKNTSDFSAGSHLFFEARLLVLPIRSDRRQFFRAVCPEIMKEVIESWKVFGYKPQQDTQDAFQFIADRKTDAPKILSKTGEPKGFSVEHWDFSDQDISPVTDPGLEKAEKIFGEHLVVVDIDSFKALCKKLPVIARNQLENGMSQNLFYEEVVPRESRFFTFIMRPRENNMTNLTSWLNLDDKRIQIGANATIGYGQCHFSRLPGLLTPKNK